jgi:hypothetical protein
MSFANPTKIRLGMTATLFGRTYRVIGRSVLGETEDSGTYFWHEFNLESSGGKYATLVFEETGSRGQWKFFEMFDPANPMTANEAAEKHIYDSVNLHGTALQITLVQRSRVYSVEGKLPEGVRVGQVAHYFNAEAGDKMIVVSWTGDEVEFYSGKNISVGEVASAFNFSGLGRIGFALGGGRSLLNAHVVGHFLVFGMFGLFFIFICCAVHTPARAPAVVVLPTAPLPPLATGETGVLEGRHFRIVGHALVEIAEPGLRFTRHEYKLDDDDNQEFLLIAGAGTNAATWTLGAPFEPPSPLTPPQAAALPVGQIVNLDGESPRVARLFRSTFINVERNGWPGFKPGDGQYGFSAPMKSNTLIVRWNATNVLWLKGTAVPDRIVKAAFAPGLGK